MNKETFEQIFRRVMNRNHEPYEQYDIDASWEQYLADPEDHWIKDEVEV